jgi:RNA polymerase sigma factor (sigma-70 family)
MPSSRNSAVAKHLEHLAWGDVAARSDAELLSAFVTRRDEAALAALVPRHAAMVWGVCRRLLAGHHDAEDAFQATFLVLVRKAAAVRDGSRLANWLYGVAHQTAVRVRAIAARRHRRERPAMEMPEPAAAPERDDTLLALLDQELSRLPDKYRTLIVLCDLEGRTRKEVAGQLGCPEGTVAGRLARARALLARRLGRRGLPAVSAATLAAGAAAAPAAEVVVLTTKAICLVATGSAGTAAVPARVAAVAEGVLRAMLLSKLKITTIVLLAVVAAGAGLACTVQAVSPADTDPSQPQARAEAPSGQEAPRPEAGRAPEAPQQEEQPRPLSLDEVTGKMLRDLGNRFDVELIGRTDGVVSGTGLYFFDSNLDAAAVHAGLLKPGEKAVITVTVVKCPKSGVGSTRNGVKSLPWDSARPGDTALLLQRREPTPKGDEPKRQPKDDKNNDRPPGGMSLDEAARTRAGKIATVEFRVASAKMAWTTGFNADEAWVVLLTPTAGVKDGSEFQICLTSKAISQLRRIGLIDEHARAPAGFFDGKTLRLTGIIEAGPDRGNPGAKGYRLCIFDLDHLEVVK